MLMKATMCARSPRDSAQDVVGDRRVHRIRRFPVQPAIPPDEVVNTELEEAIVELGLVSLVEQADQTLYLLVSDALGVPARALQVLDVAEALHVHHPSREERADQDLVVVGD